MNLSFALFPAAAAPEPSALNLLVSGFVFVVGILALLALLTFVGGRFMASRSAKAEAPPPKPSHPSAAELKQRRQEDDDRIAAVVTAAIHVALQDHRFRVRSIRRAAPGWAQEGRRQIFSSHRIR